MEKKISKKQPLATLLWDLWCIGSVVGIWPRFIEPNLLKVTKRELFLENLPSDLEGFRILQFSDLHFRATSSEKFLRKISRQVKKLSPDLIAFTGDFLCRSKLEDEERLKNFLCSLRAPYGSFAVWGNHDYAKYVTATKKGTYDIPEENDRAGIVEGLRKIFRKQKQVSLVSERAKALPPHERLSKLLSETAFQLLDNRTVQVNVRKSKLNISGLGDYWLGRCNPEQAFKDYNRKFPGIVLTHNPDTVHHLQDYPGDLLLAGHTHGAQVNLPFLRNQFIYQEDPRLISGYFEVGKKKLYVNRGVGSYIPFRWCAPPELLLLTLKSCRHG